MDLDQEYIEYVVESSLALLAISAAYFFNPKDPITYATLLLIPLLFGYTAYISREKFKTASILASVTVIFIPLGVLMGFISLFITLSNILISLFARGTGFKNYSSVTLMPLIITGLLLGGLTFGAAQAQPTIQNNIINTVSQTAGDRTGEIIKQTELIEMQKNANRQMISTTSKATVLATSQYVLNDTEDFSDQDRTQLRQSFRNAETDIPQQLLEKSQSVEENQTINISERVKQTTANLMQANFGIIIIAIALVLYTLNPLIALLTAVSGLIFQKIGGE